MSSTPALRDFFHPVDPAEIANAAMTDQRLFRKTDRAATFARLLPWERLNTLISGEALMSGRVSLARLGRPVPLEMVSLPGRPKIGDWVSPEAVHALCHQGASLVLNSIERQIPAIAAMTAMIERYLRCETITNAYVSFNRDSAFKAHYDPHNVLILQLYGRKRWWCYGQKDAYPLAGKTFADEQLPEAEWEGVLEPGDFLFVPRGDVHRACVEDANSVHLTVTMTPPCGADVFTRLSQQSLGDERGRRYLRADGDPQARQEDRDALRDMFHGMVDALDLDAFLADADRLRPAARPFNLGLLQSLSPQTEVLPALRRRIDLPDAQDGDVRLMIGGTTLTLNAAERDVLAALLSADALTVAQIEAMLPARDVHGAVASLARKALIFLFSST
jgi:hypothetical protein